MNLAPADVHMYAELIKPSDSRDCGYCGHEVDPNDKTHAACFTHRFTGKGPRSFWAHGDCCEIDRKRKGLRPAKAA
jgi:hypothetical protein